ncbi:PAS domain S-box protein [Paenibacillus agaridevorans]|uniref:PAS domain S-box protein n=1 Tax=Paenibacillus agaridevorans TaxID=171404 RepID=UPI001BE4DDB4|nr:PAS domain S-box protein [Paenibacillus agaridevorans]
MKQQGMTFKFKKVNGRYIHTFIAGKLLTKIGLTPRIVIGRELRDFISAELAIYKETFYRDAWEGNEDIIYEGELNGVYYMASLQPIRQFGKVIEVIASCVDITERKRSEEELRATKELLESVIKNSVDSVCITDIEGKVIRVNDAFEKIYGWSEKELVGKKLPNIPENLYDSLVEICKPVLTGTKAISFETMRKRKDGELIHVFLTLSPIKDARNAVVALTGIARDITERKKSEEFFRKADKLNVVGQLAAGLAHEIRNPLASLRGFLQLFLSGHEGKSEYFDIMISEIDRINSIVSELLIISKPHATSFQENNIGIILRSVVTLLEAQATLNNIQFHVEIKDNFPLVESSEIEIKQVFVNILKNAIEAMPNGGIIRIKAIVQTDNLLIRFIDEGSGINESIITRLGEPFFTTKDNGTGLGLMMCYKIINEHKGRMHINSVINKGTTIDVILPTPG